MSGMACKVMTLSVTSNSTVLMLPKLSRTALGNVTCPRSVIVAVAVILIATSNCAVALLRFIIMQTLIVCNESLERKKDDSTVNSDFALSCIYFQMEVSIEDSEYPKFQVRRIIGSAGQISPIGQRNHI